MSADQALRCPHRELSENAVQVLAQCPPGYRHVACPCCHRWGWKLAEDTEPMFCPDCEVEAEWALEATVVPHRKGPTR